uniref:Uncharacterized protein n=1 Tax=Arundo donax TaxID=35708 RepID=A0A0A9HP77_ARUDO
MSVAAFSTSEGVLQ